MKFVAWLALAAATANANELLEDDDSAMCTPGDPSCGAETEQSNMDLTTKYEADAHQVPRIGSSLGTPFFIKVTIFVVQARIYVSNFTLIHLNLKIVNSSKR